MQTKLHTYNYNTYTREGDDAYKALRKTLKSQSDQYGAPRRRIVFTVDPSARPGSNLASHYLRETPSGGLIITLDPKFLFADQWNTTADSPNFPNTRVFDWVEDGLPNRLIKRGHFLTITEEMQTLRSSTYKCGYCGHQTTNLEGKTFCTKCLNGPYLKAEDLCLLRYRPVSAGFAYTTPELTQGELDGLMPAYIEAQTTGTARRSAEALAKEQKDVANKAAKAHRDARIEEEGMQWLLTRGIGTKNTIYYPHTGKFAMGWYTTLDPATGPAWESILMGFPGMMELKFSDGSTQLLK